MANIAFTLNDLIQAVQPGPFYKLAVEQGWETDHWANKANSFHWLAGMEPSYGYLLFRWADIQTIIEASPISTVELTIQTKTSLGDQGNQNRSRVIGNLYVKSVQALYSRSTTTSANTVCLVHLVDKQHVFAMTHIATSYNVPSVLGKTNDPAEADYYDAESLEDSTTVWTWATMWSDLWLQLPGTISGGTPALPYTPDGRPTDFQFWGLSVWEAIGIFLNKINCDLVLDHSTNTFSLFQKGVAQTGLAALLSGLGASSGVSTFNPYTAGATRYPANVKVMFPKVPMYFGTSKEIARIENRRQETFHVISTATSLTGAVADTAMTVFDELEALVDFDGTISNSSALNARATEVTTKFKNRLVQPKPDRRSYQGLITTLSPGSEIGHISFADYADRSGLITTIEQTCENTSGKEASPLGAFGKSGSTHSLSSRKNFGATDGPGFPNLKDASRYSYPHHTHIVEVYEAGTDVGDPVVPSSGFTSGRIIRANPADSFVTAAAYESGESCWIAVTNKYVGSGNTSARLVQGDIYLAKINGYVTADEETDPRPLFVLHRAENNIWHVTATNTVAAGATAEVTLPDGRMVDAVNWSLDTEITSGDKITVFLDLFNNVYYQTKGGGTSSSTIVKVTGTTKDETTCAWDGLIQISGTTETAYCTNHFTDGDACLLVVLNIPNGSVTTGSAAQLVVGERYIATRIGQVSLGGDPETFIQVYATRIENNFIHPITLGSPLADGASVSVTIPSGSVSATNKSGQTLDAGNATAYRNQTDLAWYLTGAAALSTKVWYGVAQADIDAGDTGDVLISDTALGTVGVVVAKNQSSHSNIFDDDKVLCWQDPIDDNFYCIGTRACVWAATAQEDIAPNTAGDVLLPDTDIGTAGVVSATNWSTIFDIRDDDKVFCWRDSEDNLFYCLGTRKAESRMFVGFLNGDLTSASASAPINMVGGWALDGGTVPTITTADNSLHLSGEDGYQCLLVEDWGNLAETLPTYKLFQVKHITVTPLTDLQYDSGTKVWQKKSKKVTVLWEEDESDWVNITSPTMTELTAITNLRYDTGAHALEKKTRTAQVAEISVESGWTEVWPMVDHSFVENITGSGLTVSWTEKIAYFWEETESAGGSITLTYTPPPIPTIGTTVVQNVLASGMNIYQDKWHVEVFDAYYLGRSLVVSGTSCESEAGQAAPMTSDLYENGGRSAQTLDFYYGE
jgi:hypothetical protein